MPFTISVFSGPGTGRKFDLPDGVAVPVGRNDKSRFIIRDDAHLSGAHFSVECHGEKCKIRDLSSTNGTFVNGLQIVEREIGIEEIISAGSCTFRLLPAIVEEWAGFSASQKTILSLIYGYGQPVFAVLDAAREDRLPAFLQAYSVEHASLYEGDGGDRLKDVAPYLALLPKTSSLLKLLMSEGWGKSWGVFLNANVPFADVRKHLRKFLTVQNEEGSSLYFRFYDPRVLRVFLPTCTREERSDFFGPISRFVLEGEDLARPLEFTRAQLDVTIFDRGALKE